MADNKKNIPATGPDGKHTVEDVLSHMVGEAEARNMNATTNSPANTVIGASQQRVDAMESQPVQTPKPSLREAQEARREEIHDFVRANRLGWQPIALEDLPSGGIFYPVDVKINVRAATGGDIRYWSMTDNRDITQIDDALNYVLERCVSVSNPNGGKFEWKDLKEIDRFYLILAVRDYTFTDGHNELKIAINEYEDVVVKKDNITFINLDHRFDKFYDATERCYVFDRNHGVDLDRPLKIFMPSVGVTQWLREYVERKANAREGFDRKFLAWAPILIRDWRGLNEPSYEALANDSTAYSTMELAIINKMKDMLTDAVNPTMSYVDESGAEHETPLNFRGGLKSIFIPDVDSFLGI